MINEQTNYRRRRLRWLSVLLGLLIVIVVAVRWWFPPLDIDATFRRAVAAAEHGEHQQAADLLARILSRQPDHREALLYCGQVARDAGDSAAALEYWRAVPDLPAQFGRVARYLEGTVLLEQGRARPAEERLLHSIELDPSYLPPREHLVELYVAQIRRLDIRAQLDAIRLRRPWTLEELALFSLANKRMLEVDPAIRRLEQFVRMDSTDRFSQVALLQVYVEADMFDKARELAPQLLSGIGARNRVLGLFAEAYLHQSDQAGAATLLRTCNPSEPIDARFWRSCGMYWESLGDKQPAAACYIEAARADPEDLASQQLLGNMLRTLGREPEAIGYLQRAEWIDFVARRASRLPRRDGQNDPLIVPILLDVADALFKLQRYDEAAHWYDQSILLDPNSVRAREGLTQIGNLMARNPALVHRSVTEVVPGSESAAKLDLVRGELQKLIPTSVPHPKNVDRTGPLNVPQQIVLRDVHGEAGIDFQYFNGQTGLKFLVESMGGGVAVLDYDGDEWPDLFFPQGCTLPYDPNNRDHRDRLFRNLGNGQFKDVTESAGLDDAHYGQGCAAADYDNDGDPDLVIANLGENVFYRNNGDGTFSDVTPQVGLTGSQWSSSVAWGDLDRDGNLDLYVVTYVDSLRVCREPSGRIATCDPQNFAGVQDQLYRNRGDGTFEDVSASAGILAPDGKGLGIVVADLDNDDWPDIYIANDGTPNFLFHNQGHAKPGLANSGISSQETPTEFVSFESKGLISGTAVSGSGQAQGGMGIACADFDHNGLLDLYVTNYYLEMNTLYLNRGQLLFDDATQQTKVSRATRPMVGFGVQAVDFDYDGNQDLMIANGHIDDFRLREEPWKMPPLLFHGLGDGSFQNHSQGAGEYFHGEYLGRGVARLDWDRDGDPDLIVVHQDAPAALLSNETPREGNCLIVQLHGVESNRDGIGARLEVVDDHTTQMLENVGGDGFYASNERLLMVGLGKSQTVKSLSIKWPSGRREVLEHIPANSRVTVVEGRASLTAPLAHAADGELGPSLGKPTPKFSADRLNHPVRNE